MSTCPSCNHFDACRFNHSYEGDTTRFYGTDIACANVEELCPYHSPKGVQCKSSRDDTVNVGDILYDIGATYGRVVRFKVPDPSWISKNHRKLNKTIFKDRLQASHCYKILMKCPYRFLCLSSMKVRSDVMGNCVECNQLNNHVR